MNSKIDNLNVNEVQGQNESCAPCSRPSDGYTSGVLNLSLQDCMIGMRAYPDKYFDLAIVDPPYGDSALDGSRTTANYNISRNDNWSYYKPGKNYFTELFRVSKNQIIWGANYFLEYLLSTKCFLVWDKAESIYGRNFAECELAWTSFHNTARMFKLCPNQLDRIHPTQKPVKRYEWLLKNYAKPGDKILDTHLGSGSSAIACYNLDYHLTGFEIDQDYFTAMKRRIEEHVKQQRLFDEKKERTK